MVAVRLYSGVSPAGSCCVCAITLQGWQRSAESLGSNLQLGDLAKMSYLLLCNLVTLASQGPWQ